MDSLSLLLVDDDPIIHKLVAHYLEDMNFVITIAKDGYEAMEHLSDNTFDLIILDSSMPYVSGLQVLKKMDGKNNFDGTQVIILSSENEKEKIFKFFQHGIADYIIKPPEKQDFIKRVSKVLLKRTI